MGREATCHYQWGKEQGDCKVLLEGPELIFREGKRRTLPLSSLTNITVAGDNLVFQTGQDRVQLRLGTDVAQRWVKAMTTPPPSLARKLGISATTTLQVLGQTESRELETALAEAGSIAANNADLTLICAEAEAELHLLFGQFLKSKTPHTPLWIVYPKGAKSPVKESVVRELLRGHGWMDIKVASVSTRLTALRFVKR